MTLNTVYSHLCRTLAQRGDLGARTAISTRTYGGSIAFVFSVLHTLASRKKNLTDTTKATGEKKIALTRNGGSKDQD